MKYEWKTGDKLKVIKSEGSVIIHDGDIVIANNNIATDNDDFCNVDIIKDNGIHHNGWYAYRFEKISETGKDKKAKIKIIPIDKHLVLVDSCNNFIGIRNNYQEAEDLAKSQSGEVTIYKIIEVAKVKSKRLVSKIKLAKPEVKPKK